MKVLMLNGSSHTAGNTFAALEEIGRQLSEEGIEYEIFQLGTAPIRDCTGCHGCTEKGCVFTDDGVNEFIAKAKEADGFVFGTPVYYAHPSGRILSFLDRVFYSSGSVFAFKPGAAAMAIKAKVPVVPAAIYKQPKPFRMAHILYGKPFELSEFYDKKLTEEEIAEADEIIKNKILGLKREHAEYLAQKKAKKAKRK